MSAANVTVIKSFDCIDQSSHQVSHQAGDVSKQVSAPSDANEAENLVAANLVTNSNTNASSNSNSNSTTNSNSNLTINSNSISKTNSKTNSTIKSTTMTESTSNLVTNSTSPVRDTNPVPLTNPVQSTNSVQLTNPVELANSVELANPVQLANSSQPSTSACHSNTALPPLRSPRRLHGYSFDHNYNQIAGQMDASDRSAFPALPQANVAKPYLRRLVLRAYFVLLFVLAFIFCAISPTITSVFVLLLIFSLVVLICTNCQHWFKQAQTHPINPLMAFHTSGHILVPPGLHHHHHHPHTTTSTAFNHSMFSPFFMFPGGNGAAGFGGAGGASGGAPPPPFGATNGGYLNDFSGLAPPGYLAAFERPPTYEESQKYWRQKERRQRRRAQTRLPDSEPNCGSISQDVNAAGSATASGGISSACNSIVIGSSALSYPISACNSNVRSGVSEVVGSACNSSRDSNLVPNSGPNSAGQTQSPGRRQLSVSSWYPIAMATTSGHSSEMAATSGFSDTSGSGDGPRPPPYSSLCRAHSVKVNNFVAEDATVAPVVTVSSGDGVSNVTVGDARSTGATPGGQNGKSDDISRPDAVIRTRAEVHATNVITATVRVDSGDGELETIQITS